MDFDIVVLISLFMRDYRSIRALCKTARDKLDSSWYLLERKRLHTKISEMPICSVIGLYGDVATRRLIDSRNIVLSDYAIEYFENLLNWEVLMCKQQLSLNIVSKYFVRMKWDVLVNSRHLAHEVALAYHHKLSCANLFMYVQFPMDILDLYVAKFPSVIAQYQNLTCEFIARNIPHIDMRLVCIYQNLSEQFMEDYHTQLFWREVSRHQVLSIPFMRANSGRLYWEDISKYQPLTYEAMKLFAHYLNWKLVIDYQDFKDFFQFAEAAGEYMLWSELCLTCVVPIDFLDHYSDKIDWVNVSLYQPLTSAFLRKYKDKIIWSKILDNENVYLTRDEKIEFLDYLLPDKKNELSD